MAKNRGASADPAQLKFKKKKWFKIVAPSLFDNAELGETLSEFPEELVGKTIEANLMHLTKDIKRQNINVKFKVVDVQNNAGATQMKSYVMTPASIKRLVRANRDRIDDSFVIKTSDGVHVRFKPLIITKDNLSGSKRTLMRKVVQDSVLSFCSSKTYDEMIKSVLDGSLTKEMRTRVMKVAQVRTIEVRAFNVLENVRNARFAQKFEQAAQVAE